MLNCIIHKLIVRYNCMVSSKHCLACLTKAMMHTHTSVQNVLCVFSIRIHYMAVIHMHIYIPRGLIQISAWGEKSQNPKFHNDLNTTKQDMDSWVFASPVYARCPNHLAVLPHMDQLHKLIYIQQPKNGYWCGI